jgi:hypothetical protein
MKDIKEQLKGWAIEIRQLKNTRKIDKRGDRKLWEIESDIYRMKFAFRHTHIVCSELRGRTREQIERPKENNLADQRLIDSIKQDITERLGKELHEFIVHIDP